MSATTSALPVRAAHDSSSGSCSSLPEPWLDPTTDDRALLSQVAEWYQRCLVADGGAQQSLARRGLVHPELLTTFGWGFADRRLGALLPGPKTHAGKALRARLQQLGLLRESGHGHFNGSLTLPIYDAAGALIDIYGRKATRNLVRGTELHCYLSAPADRRGVFNAAGLSGTDTVILTDSPLNALSFWSARLRNVTCTWHEQATIGDDLVATLTESTASRVVLAFRNTKQGVTHGEAVASRLTQAGLEVLALTFPANRDANDVLLRSGPAQLVVLVQERLSRSGTTMTFPVLAREDQPSPLHAEVNGKPPEEEDVRAAAEAELPPPAPIVEQTTPEERSSEQAALDLSQDLHFTFDDRHYRVRGLGQNLSLQHLKINLRVCRDGLFHVTLLDLYSATQRKMLIREAADELHVLEEQIKRDLGALLQQLETLQEQHVASVLKPAVPQPLDVTGPERDQALALLHDPKLLHRVAGDYERCGLVGEAANKQLCYLACVSRLLDQPLAVLIQSSSAAGKTTLMDHTLALMPPETVLRYSALTGQSLYYMGQQELRHKIFAVAEEQGVTEASYALKLLQSDGHLRIASAGKDQHTGRHSTQQYEVEGPVMMFLTTTAETPDGELQNRCLTLRVNESPEQTAAIHALQRARYTLEGPTSTAHVDPVRRTHQNAQRLLKRYRVVIPWAERLTFRRDQTRMRRDHEKYLTLIAAVTLLYQYQRKRIQDPAGQPCVVATLDDVELAGRLTCEAFGQSLDALMPETRQLLMLLDDHITQRAMREQRPRLQVRFKQRELREALGWSDFSLRTHLARLVELEYVVAYRTGRGNEREYELLYEGQGRHGDRFQLGIIPTKELALGEVR
ncbi:MAG: hypothetical protein R3E01_22555 [Pirellulaceae bacterium]